MKSNIGTVRVNVEWRIMRKYSAEQQKSENLGENRQRQLKRIKDMYVEKYLAGNTKTERRCVKGIALEKIKYKSAESTFFLSPRNV